MELSLSDNKKFLIVDSCTTLEYEQLKSSLTKRIDGWRFHPLVKKKVWDGNISFIKRNRVPSGLWKEVVDVCKEYDLQLGINNVTELFDKDIDEVKFREWVKDFFKDHPEFKPREYQIDATFKILKYRRCLAELATSAGKTLIAFMIVAYLMENLGKKRILIIVPNVSLVLQATGDFEQYNYQSRIPLKIQQIYAGVKLRKSSNIVIGTYQSLVKKDAEYFEQFDAVMVDETHKAKATSIQKITDKCWHCDYRFGLSGTIPKRGTVDRLTLMSALGPLVTQIKAAQLQEEGFISYCKVIQLEMEYATESQKEAFYQLSRNYEDRQRLFNLEQNFINQSDRRLNFICNVIGKTNTNSLVLFHKIAYGEKIYNKLRETTDKKVYYVDGSINKDIREEFKRRMEKDENVIIVASYGTFSTGISIKNIHNIFFTESFKSEVIIRQSIGRGLRKHHTKSHVKIFDFIDDLRYQNDGADWLNYVYRHGMQRRKIYKEEKFPCEVQSIRF